MSAPRATESQCQATIVATAKMFGWRVHAERAANSGRGWRTPIQGHAGFPDLVLVRDGRALVVELKRRPNKVEPEQQEWLDALAAAGLEARVVWVPEQLDAFTAELATRESA